MAAGLSAWIPTMSYQNSPKNKVLCQEPPGQEPDTWGRKRIQTPAAMVSVVSFPGDTVEQCAHRGSTLASDVPRCTHFPGTILSQESLGPNSQASVHLVSLRGGWTAARTLITSRPVSISAHLYLFSQKAASGPGQGQKED